MIKDKKNFIPGVNLDDFNNKRKNLLIIINYICTNNLRKIVPTNLKPIHDILRRFYTYALLGLIIWSFVNTSLEVSNSPTSVIIVAIVDIAMAFYLLIDLILWAITYPLRSGSKQIGAFLFPLSFPGIVIILSLLPSLWVFGILPNIPEIINGNKIETPIDLLTLKSLIFFRLGRIMMLLAIFGPFKLLIRVFTKQWKTLLYVFITIIALILIFAAIILNAERVDNNNLKTYWDSVYFVTISMVTIGYGDITPVTSLGRAIVIVMSIIGIALFAIPSGIIASSFLLSVEKKITKTNSNKATSFIQRKLFQFKKFFLTEEKLHELELKEKQLEKEAKVEVNFEEESLKLQRQMMEEIKYLRSKIDDLENNSKNV
ncbi:ion transporter [Mycoplasmopsis agassizii]|uniref:ion transporter n=1 Tax=Mycoplasmopsis agassizii TaxID=33922 RepID=UPI0035289404